MTYQIVSYEKTQIFDRNTRKVENEFETLEALEAAVEESEMLTDLLQGNISNGRLYRTETSDGQEAY
jgi:hypothetical protein